MKKALYQISILIGVGLFIVSCNKDTVPVTNERIDLITEWDTNLKMWGENPGRAGTPPFGDWYSATSQNYLAIRLNNERFGWVEVDTSNAKNPKLISFAIQN